MQPKQYTSTMHDLDITDAYCILGYTTRVAGVQVISKNVMPPSHQRDNIISQEFNLQSFFFHYMDRNELVRLMLELLASMQYILKQLLTSVLVKVVDTYQAILQLGKYPPLLSFQLQTLSSSYQLFFLVTLCRRAWPHLLWS